MKPPAPAVQPAVAYVVAEYPAVSHTFVTREILALRTLGVRVATFSVRRARAAGLLTETDRAEFDSTESLRPLSWTALAGAHARVAARHPGAYLAVLGEAVSASPPGVRARIWQLFYFAQAVILFERCRAARVTRLHAHFANVAADLSWLAARLGQRAEPAAGWSWSFTMHGPTEWFAVERFNLARKAEQAAVVLCISEFCRSQMMTLVSESHWSKLKVVHCGVDTVALGPLDRRGRSSPVTEILCVGRLTPEKGQAVLLDAVADLVGRGHPVRLTLVGDGPSRAALTAKADQLGITGAVRFLGALGQDELVGQFEAADVFCLPSFAEGLPVVLMEAMARSLPVVTTPIAGIPELVADGRNGLLVPPGRADLLASALERLVGDAGLRQELGDRGRRAVESGFDIRRCGATVGEWLGVVGPGTDIE